MNRIERAKTLPETLTLSEAAQFFRVSRPTLLKALKDGQVSGIKIGRNWRIPRSQFLKPPTKEGLNSPANLNRMDALQKAPSFER